MTAVEKLEQAVSRLSPVDLAQFRAWFATFDADAWDRQIDSDVRAGRLDTLADEALKELHPAIRRLFGVAAPRTKDRDEYRAHGSTQRGPDDG